jgi:hypothetical protein
LQARVNGFHNFQCHDSRQHHHETLSPEGAEVSLANGAAGAVLFGAIIYDLFAYLPWQMAVLIIAVAIVVALVVLFPTFPSGGGKVTPSP